MPAPAQCPGCGTALEPGWIDCPNCPMSFRDDETRRGASKSAGLRAAFLPAAVMAVVAAAVWAAGLKLWRQADAEAPASAQGEPAPAFPAPALPAAPADPIAPAPADAALAAIAEPPEDGRMDAVSVSADPERPKARPAREWRLRGVVHDLVTLKPVPGCAMVFTDIVTNFRAETMTDAEGRYRIILPPLRGRGYSVAISMPGYAASYLNPGTEGVSAMPPARREELARELAGVIAEPHSLQPRGEAPLTTDFHIAPKR